MDRFHVVSDRKTVAEAKEEIGRDRWQQAHTVLLLDTDAPEQPALYLAKNCNGPTGAVTAEEWESMTGIPLDYVLSDFRKAA